MECTWEHENECTRDEKLENAQRMSAWGHEEEWMHEEEEEKTCNYYELGA